LKPQTETAFGLRRFRFGKRFRILVLRSKNQVPRNQKFVLPTGAANKDDSKLSFRFLDKQKDLAQKQGLVFFV